MTEFLFHTPNIINMAGTAADMTLAVILAGIALATESNGDKGQN